MTDNDAATDQPLQIDGALAVATQERTELHDLCVKALAELLGSAPATDEDGDIAVPVHGFGVYVTVADDGPQLHVWSSILTGLGDRTRAAQRLADLAPEWPRLRFTFSDDRLLVSTILDADPFAPQHLVNLVDEIHEFTHELDDDFAQSFGGTLDCDEDDSYAGGCGGCGDDCACGAAPVDGELGITAVTT
ncbi:MAG: hypothetical protein GX610_04880 [Rhodococcus sp.]|nr:hypothetical protein [Rhodococcus sp. (in: high G+C Gram-positive bacteria)]